MTDRDQTLTEHLPDAGPVLTCPACGATFMGRPGDECPRCGGTVGERVGLAWQRRGKMGVLGQARALLQTMRAMHRPRDAFAEFRIGRGYGEPVEFALKTLFTIFLISLARSSGTFRNIFRHK